MIEAHGSVLAASHICLGDSLSSSQAPRLGRPVGVASRWLRQPRPGTHSQGLGACEEMREDQDLGACATSSTTPARYSAQGSAQRGRLKVPEASVPIGLSGPSRVCRHGPSFCPGQSSRPLPSEFSARRLPAWAQVTSRRRAAQRLLSVPFIAVLARFLYDFVPPAGLARWQHPHRGEERPSAAVQPCHSRDHRTQLDDAAVYTRILERSPGPASAPEQGQQACPTRPPRRRPAYRPCGSACATRRS